VDCLQSMSKAMRPIAQTLRQFVRMTEEEEGVRVHHEARELESRVDVLDEALSEVEGKAKSIPYTRRRALPATPATSTVTKATAIASAAATKTTTTASAATTKATATVSAAAAKAPKATLSLGSLITTAEQTATQPIFSSRMEVELARPTQDPDRDLLTKIDQAFGAAREAGGSGRNNSSGSSRPYQTPPGGDYDDDHVATPQSIRSQRTRTTGKSSASRQKSPRK
jgi:hypothetical protein